MSTEFLHFLIWNHIIKHISLLHSLIHISRQRHFPALMWNEVTTFGCHDNQAPRLEPYWICSQFYLLFSPAGRLPARRALLPSFSNTHTTYIYTYTSTIFQWRSNILFPSDTKNWRYIYIYISFFVRNEREKKNKEMKRSCIRYVGFLLCSSAVYEMRAQWTIFKASTLKHFAPASGTKGISPFK